jgi:hypothetical protein
LAIFLPFVALQKYCDAGKEQRTYMKTGYSILTWKKKLICPEPQWLTNTEDYFREVTKAYYELLKDRPPFWDRSTFDIQRELEQLTVSGRDGRVPQYSLPYDKVPVYLRRAAMNKAAAAVKSTLETARAQEDEEADIHFPEQINPAVTFFKGMYSDLTDTGIRLKLWNGRKWVWTECTLTGREFPPEGILMSPTLARVGKRYTLHIPVKQENADARTAKERMAAGTKLCSVRFTNTDVFAMCCVLDENGKQTAAHSCRGGDAYRHRSRQLLEKIESSSVYTKKDNSSQPNRKYFLCLKHLSEHYAHQVSREIIDFCLKEKAGVIVLPAYDEDFSRMVMYKSGNYSPLHLSSRIREYLTYKAWSAGLLILEVNASGIGGTCAICGAPAHKKGKMFYCGNGHEGNRFLNEARCLGIRCQESFRKNAGK